MGIKEKQQTNSKKNCKADELHFLIDCFEVPKGLLWSRGMQNEKEKT